MVDKTKQKELKKVLKVLKVKTELFKKTSSKDLVEGSKLAKEMQDLITQIQTEYKELLKDKMIAEFVRFYDILKIYIDNSKSLIDFENKHKTKHSIKIGVAK